MGASDASMRLALRKDAPMRPATRVSETCTARDLCVVLHDVAPSRWAGCQRVMEELDNCAREAGVTLPLTLLVVPRMHGNAEVPAPYLRWLYTQAAAGHELALHGLTHRDEGPPPSGLRQRLLRRVYTAGEGEFAALTQDQAAARLREGRAWARALGLDMEGFVPPAWLLSPASLKAVATAGFGHTCTLTEVIALPHGRLPPWTTCSMNSTICASGAASVPMPLASPPIATTLVTMP